MSKFNSHYIERNMYLRPKPGTKPEEHHYEQYERPVIVCLCGSTRFLDAFLKASREETLAGKIVLSVGTYGHLQQTTVIKDGCMGPQEVAVWTLNPGGMSLTPEQKLLADELHKRKIDLADEVLILNVGGYIGESTRSELEYARRTHKTIRFLEPEKDSSNAT